MGSGAGGAAEAFLAAALMGGARTSSGDGTGCCEASTDFRPAAETDTAGAGARAGGARTGAAGAATIGGGAGTKFVS